MTEHKHTCCGKTNCTCPITIYGREVHYIEGDRLEPQHLDHNANGERIMAEQRKRLEQSKRELNDEGD